MALAQYGPYLNDEDIASMLSYDVINQPDDIHHFQPPPEQRLPDCPICLNPIAHKDLFIPSSCGHAFCKACFQDYLTTTARETKKFPILCPSCPEPADPQRCLHLVQDLPDVYASLSTLILEKQHISRIEYCANPSCSAPFDYEYPTIPQHTDAAYMVVCPVCHTRTCVRCKSIWHVGKTCAQHLSEQSNSGFNRLAVQMKWRRCPTCANMIERRLGDCYFVKCRCGTGFCHRCGVPYKDLNARPENSHGTPGCNCGLFEPNAGAQRRGAPEAHNAAAGVRPIGGPGQVVPPLAAMNGQRVGGNAGGAGDKDAENNECQCCAVQ